MTSQSVLVVLATTLALAYLARRAWRSWRGSGCASGCVRGGCATTSPRPALVPAEDLLRRYSASNGGKANG